MAGLFISFEGIEGAGKSTQARRLAEALKDKGYDVVLTTEPGGTRIGQTIREVLLNPENKAMDSVAELLLYAADRRQHLHELVRPALADGKVVITDRYSDSTRAYQGTARGLDLDLIEELDRIAAGGLKPGLTILLDMDVEDGLQRNRHAGKSDRLELEALEFHKRVREGFHEIASAEPERVKLIRSDRPKDDVHADILATALTALESD